MHAFISFHYLKIFLYSPVFLLFSLTFSRLYLSFFFSPDLSLLSFYIFLLLSSSYIAPVIHFFFLLRPCVFPFLPSLLALPHTFCPPLPPLSLSWHSLLTPLTPHLLPFWAPPAIAPRLTTLVHPLMIAEHILFDMKTKG